MKHRIFVILILLGTLLSLLSACSPSQPQGASTQPQGTSTFQKPTATLSSQLPKLVITPNTGFYLNCSQPITESFDVYNAGGQDAMWVTHLRYMSGAQEDVQGITVTPHDGTLVAGGHLKVTMQGKASASFILSFMYKESPSRMIGISQAITCQS